MSDVPTLPIAARPLVAFPSLLRRHAFSVAPEQTATFIEAVGLLGPNGMVEIHRAARATLAPPLERQGEFDALFRAHFWGQSHAAPATHDDNEEDDLRVQDAAEGWTQPPEAEELDESGKSAARVERLGMRSFAGLDEAAMLRRFRLDAKQRLPKRRARRLVTAKAGPALNMRKLLQDAVRHDGEIITLPKRRRRLRQRRILLLIDVSGSMKALTDGHLRLAHSLTRAADRLEIFTIGTRLTRVTKAIRRPQADQALSAAAGLVADWDGGTRLGDALDAFLAVPRFAGFARGALILVLSDGLERGDPGTMVDAVTRMRRLAWRLVWLTPLAAGPGFEPRTEALQAIRPYLDHLGDGATLDRIAAQILAAGERGRL